MIIKMICFLVHLISNKIFIIEYSIINMKISLSNGIFRVIIMNKNHNIILINNIYINIQIPI